MKSNPWYIDALDARAGHGFASCRSTERELDRPSVFFKPPDFRPVHVSNSAIGLAATRSSLQHGLYVDGREIPFGSLEDVLEFARRCYVAGGGHGGGGAGGTLGQDVPPPLPPVDSGASSQFDWEKFLISPDEENQAQVAEFTRKSEGIIDGLGQPFTWATSAETPQQLESRLQKGAVAVGWETLRCLAEMAPLDFEKAEAWLPMCIHMRWALAGVGGWNSFHEALSDDTPPLSTLASLLHADIGYVRDFLFELHDFDNLVSRKTLENVFDVGDPIDCLDKLPLPRALESLFSKKEPAKRLTLHDLLVRYVARPQNLPDKDVFCVALFAAALITYPSLNGERWFRSRHPSSFAIASEAMRWLNLQLPRRVFGANVEKLVTQTGAISFRDGQR